MSVRCASTVRKQDNNTTSFVFSMTYPKIKLLPPKFCFPVYFRGVI